jgi:hypothetical protein
VILCDIDSLNKRINLYSTLKIFSVVREVRISDYIYFLLGARRILSIKISIKKEANEFCVFHKITFLTNPNKRYEIT